MEKTARAIVDAMENMDVLEALPRTGYLLRGVRPAENIAAHCFATVYLAMLLADLEGDVDCLKVMRMAVLHEAGEAATSDIPRVAKGYFPEGAFESAEILAGADVLGELEHKGEYLQLIEEYVAGQTREAKLVHAADKLQMLCKVRFYEKAGQRNLAEFFEKDQGMDLDDLPVARAVLKLLRDRGA